MAERRSKGRRRATQLVTAASYGDFVLGISVLLDEARRSSARVVNSILAATYWEIGRRIVEFEQGGKKRAEYGEGLLQTLAGDLTQKFGRGFSARNFARCGHSTSIGRFGRHRLPNSRHGQDSQIACLLHWAQNARRHWASPTLA